MWHNNGYGQNTISCFDLGLDIFGADFLTPRRARKILQAGVQDIWHLEPGAADAPGYQPLVSNQQAGQGIEFFPWIINAAPAGSAAPGPFPCLSFPIRQRARATPIMIQHPGWPPRGFVVAAPTHPRDCMDNMDDLFTWDQITDRMDNIKTTIDFILKDEEMSKIISLDKIGLLAYGAGGTAARFFTGRRRADCALWPGWCKKSAGKTRIAGHICVKK